MQIRSWKEWEKETMSLNYDFSIGRYLPKQELVCLDIFLEFNVVTSFKTIAMFISSWLAIDHLQPSKLVSHN
jgi:hypothetical protein